MVTRWIPFTYNDGKPKKRFKIFTAMTIPVCVELVAKDQKGAIEELVETGEMGVNFPHIIGYGGGKIVIPTVTNNVFYIGEEATVVEVEDDE
ncbi:hypothetical protein ABEY01_08335 [Bacillus velezensis]|uniref:hypothetical protein n=1 Tax=Bacillus TaxID=1386 RepID=UPI001CEF94A7|nr:MULTISPECIES: hypothetical protein [Bacillus]MDF3255313.1 hypothetical protein [Bacillus velezensis]MDF3267458.1 hypothetical protein [Bacillus velezensis]MEC3633175.1 hypothetical protein [Bacillus velezensis]UFH20931.1 hypothetical protein LOK79_09605 [Bacillus velezensis]UUT15547.1 hypothetical protein NRF13_10185 [Bacillus velezensis]